MLKTVEDVRERVKQKSNSKKRNSRTILCKQQNFVGQSGERGYFREISFICCAQNIVLVGIRKVELNKVDIKDGLCSNIKFVM